MTRRPAYLPPASARFAWMLWLALLLPLAQAAAGWHAQSHWNTDRGSRSGDPHGLAGDPCELCLTAAGLSSGAAPAASAVPVHAAAPRAVPSWRPVPARPAPVVLGYESRAPPFSLR